MTSISIHLPPPAAAGNALRAAPSGIRELGNGSAVFAGIGGAVIDARAEIAHHRLAASKPVGKTVVHQDHVSFGFQFRPYVPRNPILQLHLAALKTDFRKTRRLHGGLDILVEV